MVSTMATLTEHLIKLTDHRERDLLELTLTKALIDLVPIQRVVIARVSTEDNEKRWLDIVSLDARGGGKVVDPLRIDFQSLPRLEDAYDRLRSLRGRQEIEVAWAGEDGPRIYYLPLFADSRADDEQGVIEIHSAGVLAPEDRQTIEQLHHIYRNMYTLLAYSDRDALTGLLNRKSLDDTFYSAVLEELDGILEDAKNEPSPGKERRHRVPPNYWLGTITIDNFHLLNDKHGHLIMEEVTLLVARIMNSTFRTHDRLYRFGGEQFAVLFHCPEEALALGAFERMRANVEKFSFPQVGRVTVSSGFTRVLADDSPSTALERTEQAIDFAQKNGRNKVCSHLDLVRRGLFGEVARTGSVDVF
ncbi:diguanylate cyclase [Curvibacter sp. PAE-UM]|nr:diguanylate cyclase [Curvibacter sp. PAE-UM]